MSLLSWFRRAIDVVLITWNGKRIAVLGERGVGKTHFIKFLAGQSIPQDHKQTLAPDNIGNQRIKISALDIRLKGLLDVSGAEEARGLWKKQVEQAETVFYLFRADKVIDGNTATIKRVTGDGKHLKDWLDGRAKRPRLCLVGTHCDRDPNFRGRAYNLHGDYESKVRSVPVIRDFIRRCGGGGEVKLVVGSMVGVKDTEELVTEAFREATSEI